MDDINGRKGDNIRQAVPFVRQITQDGKPKLEVYRPTTNPIYYYTQVSNVFVFVFVIDCIVCRYLAVCAWVFVMHRTLCCTNVAHAKWKCGVSKIKNPSNGFQNWNILVNIINRTVIRSSPECPAIRTSHCVNSISSYQHINSRLICSLDFLYREREKEKENRFQSWNVCMIADFK